MTSVYQQMQFGAASELHQRSAKAVTGQVCFISESLNAGEYTN